MGTIGRVLSADLEAAISLPPLHKSVQMARRVTLYSALCILSFKQADVAGVECKRPRGLILCFQGDTVFCFFLFVFYLFFF